MKRSKSKKSPTFKKALTLLYFLLLAALIAWLFLGLGERIMYSKTLIGRIIPLVLVFAGIPYCLFKLLSSLNVKQENAKMIAILSVFVLGPGFGFWSKYTSENDLEKYGVITYGTVAGSSSGKKSGIYATFTWKSETYTTFTVREKKHTYRIGESIRVRFSTRNPENNQLLVE
ncbi:MAG: hypothetical protein V4604_05515 [Bacteroidota bacterium]